MFYFGCLLVAEFAVHYRIHEYCNSHALANNQSTFTSFDNLSPLVLTKHCFDDLLVPPDHVSRQPSDTYFVDEHTVRCATVESALYECFVLLPSSNAGAAYAYFSASMSVHGEWT
jgi:phenylalanyl-tRNA synthetase alpha subunit